MAYELPVYEYRAPPELSAGRKKHYPVIIVGAGLAGLTAALELGTRGIQTVLLDEDNTPSARSRSSTASASPGASAPRASPGTRARCTAARSSSTAK